MDMDKSKLEKNDDVMTEGKRSLLTLVFEFFQNKNKVCDRYLLTHVIRNVYKDDEKRMNKIETQHMIEEVGVGKVDINLDEFLNVMSSRMSNVIDLTVNDGMTEEQKERLIDAFTLFQTDDTKVCDKVKMVHVMRSLYGEKNEMNKDETQRLIDEIEVGKKEINVDEFLKIMSKRMETPHELKDLIDSFSIFKHDEDGRITVEEFKELMMIADNCTAEEVEDCLKIVNIDDKGSFSSKEFIMATIAKVNDEEEDEK
jgi:Ca2+-binding EF-hand superfamily protein